MKYTNMLEAKECVYGPFMKSTVSMFVDIFNTYEMPVSWAQENKTTLLRKPTMIKKQLKRSRKITAVVLFLSFGICSQGISDDTRQRDLTDSAVLFL